MTGPAPLATTVVRGGDAMDVLRRVARRTRGYDFTAWFWGDAIAVDGLVDAAELAGDEASRAHARRFLDAGADRPMDWVGHLTPGAALLRSSGAQPPTRVVDRAVRLAQWLDSVPRAGRQPLYRPDQPQYRHTVWVDSLYHVPPFLAALARVTGDQRFAGQALEVWQAHVEVLRDGRGPFLAHSYDTGSRVRHGYGWGRGSGWAALGMVDTLRLLPDPPPWALEQLRDLCDAVLRAQDSTGFWRTLLHDREAYLETSVTALFGAVYTAAVAAGLLPGTYREAADRAWHAVSGRVDADGSCWGVSACTWAGSADVNDDAMYKTLPTEVNVWGQGSVMRFAAERIRADSL
jgi:unsaturated rhamnogalacturonyl hydrolase